MKLNFFLTQAAFLCIIFFSCDGNNTPDPVYVTSFHIILKKTDGTIVKDKTLESCSVDFDYPSLIDNREAAIVFWGEDQEGGGDNEYNFYIWDQTFEKKDIQIGTGKHTAFLIAQADSKTKDWYSCYSGKVEFGSYDFGVDKRIEGKIVDALLIEAVTKDTFILDATFEHRVE